MNYLRELGIILALCAAGDVLSALIGGALPGNVLGMILLLVLLLTRALKTRHIEHAADFFLKNMAIFFLPVSLGILELYTDLHGQLAAILLTRALKTRHIEHAADFFLKNMAIFFLPVSLGILELYTDLHGQLAAIFAVCVLTTFVTAFVTAGTVHLVLRFQRRRQKGGDR